ncbi:MAG TPA: bifunctional methionine sulfoxide reductase B/A protein [Planctomycetaceae bacterium]|nr:bifunctional methionine sulfoxide reductase B/A protein [Planctomycetaceae bacterium]
MQVHVFNQQGQLVGPVETAPVVLSDQEWQRRLGPERYKIVRGKGTEPAFCGTLLDNKQNGVYTCAGCGLPLFSSDSKFNSGTGWPSFYQSIAQSNVEMRRDSSHGMQRVEILCARCGGHLGHVFDDGPRPTGLRFCLNSESLFFTPGDRLASLADPAAEALRASAAPTASGPASPSAELASAVFAGGCFWCTEAAFEQLEGVIDVESGYAGGSAETANYQRVCDGDTGHAEAIRVTYDPRRISYEKLLDVFFDAHDPTQLDRQGGDVGTQYRSAIFFANQDEKDAAEVRIRRLNDERAFSRAVVTTVEPLETFYRAEDYHQDYARHHPDQPYIQFHAIPKACRVREKHAELIKRDKP